VNDGVVSQVSVPRGLIAGSDGIAHELRTAQELGLRDSSGVLRANRESEEKEHKNDSHRTPSARYCRPEKELKARNPNRCEPRQAVPNILVFLAVSVDVEFQSCTVSSRCIDSRGRRHMAQLLPVVSG
jgi:hypothetical protein